jgi:hypothetical protein
VAAVVLDNQGVIVPVEGEAIFSIDSCLIDARPVIDTMNAQARVMGVRPQLRNALEDFRLHVTWLSIKRLLE